MLWGLVGLLSFLALHQAYLLIGGGFLGVAPVAGVAAVVFAVTAVATYYTEGRLGPFEGEPPAEASDEGEPREQSDTASTDGLMDGSTGGPTAEPPESEPELEPEPASGFPADDESETDEDEWIWGG